MNGLSFPPPSVDFDPPPANELARWETGTPAANEATRQFAAGFGPFNGYVRTLTPEGGVLIFYKDQYRNSFLACLRVLGWFTATGYVSYRIFFVSSFSASQCLLVFALLTLATTIITRLKIKVSHIVEIRPDAMIVDGEDVFYAEDVGDNWPELQMKDDDPNRMTICGICGTRFIEYMTANRLDKNDRTPEVLAADLKAAMEQLWGRREVTFATAL